MQKASMFQSFMKKKEMINKMITESKSTKNTEHFKHFQAVSQPVYVKAESNAIYLTHLNSEFKDQLREFVHQQQGFKQTMFQLSKITESIQQQHQSLKMQHKKLNNNLSQTQLQKQCLSDKNDILLNKILTHQQQTKSLQLRGQQYEKIATALEEDIQYENCILVEIKAKNTEVVEKLQIKSAQIENATAKLEDNEKQIRQKESKVKATNDDMKSIYFTLQAQDDALSNLCTAIQQGLNKQNDRINDIQFAKNDLTRILSETEKRKKQLKATEQIQQKLLNYSEDLDFEIRRTSKQLEIENKGIDQEYWKIEQQHQRLEGNKQMLAELQEFLTNLINKNQMMEKCLEEQIIQDYAVKKVVESKCLQPVGKKTKLFLEEFEGKEMGETQSTWVNNNDGAHYSPAHRLNQTIVKSPMSKFAPTSTTASKTTGKRQIGRLSYSNGRVPQQLDFMFDFSKTVAQCPTEQEQDCCYERSGQYLTSGFSYNDCLAHLQAEG